MANNLLDLADKSVHRLQDENFIYGKTKEGIPYKAPKGPVTDAEIFYNIDAYDAGISKKELKKKIKQARGGEYYYPSKPLNPPQKQLVKSWWSKRSKPLTDDFWAEVRKG